MKQAQVGGRLIIGAAVMAVISAGVAVAGPLVAIDPAVILYATAAAAIGVGAVGLTIVSRSGPPALDAPGLRRGLGMVGIALFAWLVIVVLAAAASTASPIVMSSLTLVFVVLGIPAVWGGGFGLVVTVLALLKAGDRARTSGRLLVGSAVAAIVGLRLWSAEDVRLVGGALLVMAALACLAGVVGIGRLALHDSLPPPPPVADPGEGA